MAALVLSLASLLGLLAPLPGANAGEPTKKNSPPALARLVEQQIQFSATVEPRQARPGDTVSYRVTARVAEPWHIYAYGEAQPAQGPRSTQFDLFETGGLEPVGSWRATPEAELKPEPAFDNQVFGFHEGQVVWSHQLKVPADAEPGDHEVQSQIYFQLCDPNGCKPPVYISLAPATVSIAAGAGGAAPTAAVAEPEAGAAPSTPEVSATPSVTGIDSVEDLAGEPTKKNSPPALARLVEQQVQFSATVEPKQARPGDKVTYRVTARVAEPWHIYAYSATQPAQGQGPRSTQFDLFETGGLEPVGSWAATPEPEMKAEPAFDNQVFGFHEGQVTWSHDLKVPENAEPGNHEIQSQIHFQLCDPKGCKPDVYISLAPATVSIAAGAGGAAPTAAVAEPEAPAGAAPASPDVAVAAPATNIDAEEDLANAALAAPMEAATQAGPRPPGVTSEVQNKIQEGIVPFLIFSALGGLFALIMPCVWPMVPITVNFFVKQGQRKDGSSTTKLAVTYCLAIIAIFTLVGVLFSAFMGAASLQRLANAAWLNLLVAFIFIVFGLSLLGLFEIRLPSFLLNASSRGESRGGLIGVFFMALTLTITSFTCTFPVVGGLLVLAAGGSYLYPVIGLATFATVLALPFFALALAPGLLQRVPRSGDWMNTVKVVGGLVEIGAAFKFLNIAEIALGTTPQNAWFDTEVVLSIWVVLCVVCGFYLLGLFKTNHDHDTIRVGPIRLLSGALFLFLALFLSPALFGFPPQSKMYNRLVVGLLPADSSELSMRPSTGGGGGGGEGILLAGCQDVRASSNDPVVALTQEKVCHGVQWGMSYDQALEIAKESGKPVLIDYTGVNCANCRQMEREVMPQPAVRELLQEFVTVALYTDFVPIDSISADDRENLAIENQVRQVEMTQDNTTPLYVVLTPEGEVLGARGGYIPVDTYTQFLEGTLARHEEQAALRATADSAERVAQAR